MTSFDFLPREEPGRPLYHLPPDFTSHVMQEIRMRARRRKRKRLSTILAIGFSAVTMAYLTMRSYSPAVRYEIPVAKAKPRPVPVQVTAPKPEPVRVAHTKPAHAKPKKKEAPLHLAAPQPDELVPLCRDIQPAGLNSETSVPCVPTLDPSLPQPRVYRAPGLKPPPGNP